MVGNPKINGERNIYRSLTRGEGNLDQAAVFDWFRQELRDKNVIAHNAKFEHHMLLNLGLNLEGQGCRLYDTMHLMALLDDRKRGGFSLEQLSRDILNEDEESTNERPIPISFCKWIVSRNITLESLPRMVCGT